ncbi:MAG TPA: spore germination protein, partial [Symbiobacteriaceae bacterium]|nr:spore germination protein [Symbiobacteriaceae bacterium]
DPRLRADTMTVGERSSTTVVLIYMAGLTLPDLVTEVKARLQRIRIDAVLDSGYVSELISDTTLTPFPMTRATERSDVAAAAILEGKVVLIVDGSPHALVVPTLFHEGMQAVEDYYQHWTTASFIRFLRYTYLMVALLGPATYIGLLSFHQEMLPTSLLLSIMRNREGVPFPALVEALLMEISFEALREAGVRLPRNVGQAVSIVGALVIGEAAVRAGIVSPAMVIVVAITGISSFVIPLYSSALAVRLLRFPMMILAGTFGFLGVALGLIILSVHLASLRSFGVPYMAPSMPPTMSDMKDMMIRAPWWFMRERPKLVPVLDRQRLRGNRGPHPPSETGGTRV